MTQLHGAIERDPAQHEKLVVRIKEILAQVARCVRVCPWLSRGLDGGLPQARPALTAFPLGWDSGNPRALPAGIQQPDPVLRVPPT